MIRPNSYNNTEFRLDQAFFNWRQESRAIAGRTARCGCKFSISIYFTTASCGSLPQHSFLVGLCLQSRLQ